MRDRFRKKNFKKLYTKTELINGSLWRPPDVKRKTKNERRWYGKIMAGEIFSSTEQTSLVGTEQYIRAHIESIISASFLRIAETSGYIVIRLG